MENKDVPSQLQQIELNNVLESSNVFSTILYLTVLMFFSYIHEIHSLIITLNKHKNNKLHPYNADRYNDQTCLFKAMSNINCSVNPRL